jgi:pantetheine-phosphate adenylyltransferase
MKRIAVFPGSFDPFTVGHEAIVKRALSLFDEIIIAVGANALKKSFYPVDTRKEMISKVFRDEPRVKVDHYEGLTVDYCKKNHAGYLLRGLRTAADFDFERAIAQINRAMAPDIE